MKSLYSGCLFTLLFFYKLTSLHTHMWAIFRSCLFVCLIRALGICWAIVRIWNDNNTYCDNKYHQQNPCPTNDFGLLWHNSASTDAILADFHSSLFYICVIFYSLEKHILGTFLKFQSNMFGGSQDISTQTFLPCPFNPRLFNCDSSTVKCSKLWCSNLLGWKVHDWKVHD